MYLKRLKDLRSDNDLYQKDIAKLLNIINNIIVNMKEVKEVYQLNYLFN